MPATLVLEMVSNKSKLEPLTKGKVKAAHDLVHRNCAINHAVVHFVEVAVCAGGRCTTLALQVKQRVNSQWKDTSKYNTRRNSTLEPCPSSAGSGRAWDVRRTPSVSRPGPKFERSATQVAIEIADYYDRESSVGSLDSLDASTESLGCRLSSLKLKMEVMMDDGNCQFRSCAFHLYGHQKHHQVVRDKAVRYMRDNSQMCATHDAPFCIATTSFCRSVFIQRTLDCNGGARHDTRSAPRARRLLSCAQSRHGRWAAVCQTAYLTLEGLWVWDLFRFKLYFATEKDWEQYIANMSMNRTWGDELTLVCERRGIL